MNGGWIVPAGATASPPPVAVEVVVVPPRPAYIIPKYTANLVAMFRCGHCGHTWSAPESPQPKFCPQALTEGEHANLYPLGYPF